MDADQSNDMTRGSDATGGIEPQHPLEKVLDLIARNDKDVDKPQDGIQTAHADRHRGASALAVSDPVRTAGPWGLGHNAKPPQSPTELVTSVLRYKWTLVLVAVVVSAPIIAGIWTQIVPAYRARAEVRVRPIIPRVVFRTEDSGPIPFYDSFVNTQVSIMRSLTVLQRVLDQPDVQQTKWYKNTLRTLMQRLRGDATPPLERLRDSLSIRPRPRTEIIDVSFADVSAKEAKLIVDAVLTQYLSFVKTAADQDELTLYGQLTEEYNKLASDIATQESIRAGYCRMLQTDSPQELIASKRVRLDETQARLNTIRSSIDLLKLQIERAAAHDSNEALSVADAPAEKQPEHYVDAEWRGLDLRAKTIQHQIATSLQKSNHPDNLRLAKDLEFAKELLKEREAQLNEQWRNRPADAVAMPVTAGAGSQAMLYASAPLEDQLARAQQEEKLLIADLLQQQAEFKKLFDTAVLLDKVDTDLRHKRELFDAVRQRKDQKEIERNVPGSIGVAMWAFSPSRPDQDRRVVFTVMALFFGLGLGGGVAFLRASRDKTICAFKDLPQPAQAPFLGHLPLVRTTKPLGRSLCDEIEQNHFVLVESVRVLRTALLSRLDGANHEKGATVLVTSAGEGTGKSSFTVMLGKSIAQVGKKVLLIDADFHRMTLSKRFDLLDKPGFMETLSDRAVDGLPIFPTRTAGLDVMPTGKRSKDTAAFEEVANGAFKACVGRIREHCCYDIILFDTPPILPVADATILAGQVDGTIMVEREHVSQRTHVMDALARLSTTGGHLLGTVFVGSFDRERYGYGYGYHGKTHKS